MEKQRKGITGMKPINDNSVVFENIIRSLIELNHFPDIRINYFLDPFGIEATIKAELILSTGDSFTAYVKANTQELLEKDLKEYLEERLLKEIGYKYIKRAFKKRREGVIKTEATNVFKSYLSFIRSNIEIH